MVDYETGRQMYSTLSNSARNAIRSNDATVFRNGVRETFETGYGQRTQEPDYLDAFLAPYSQEMEQALRVFERDARSGLRLLSQATETAMPVVTNYLRVLPAAELPEDTPREDRERINLQRNLERIVRELTQNLQ